MKNTTKNIAAKAIRKDANKVYGSKKAVEQGIMDILTGNTAPAPITRKAKRALRIEAEAKAATKGTTTRGAIRLAKAEAKAAAKSEAATAVLKTTTKRTSKKAAGKVVVKRVVGKRVVSKAKKFAERTFSTRGAVRKFMNSTFAHSQVEYVYGYKMDGDVKRFFPIVTNLGSIAPEHFKTEQVRVDLSIETS